jgi:hypothetical protein
MPLVKDPETLPPPVRAGIGLVAVGVDRAKKVRLGGIAGLPIRGIAALASARESVERTYEELANRGETIVARWRHQPEPRQTARTPEPAEPPLTPIPAPPAEPIVVDATPGATLEHDQLPLDDFDHLTLGSLRARLAKLDLVALVQLRDYERVHANRLPVLTMLDNRIAKVQAGQ